MKNVHSIGMRRNAFSIWLLLTLAGGGGSVLGQDALSVSATQLTPEKQAAYIFVFSCPPALSPNASLEIFFPEAMDLEKLILADSRLMVGGFRVSVEQNRALVTRSGLGNTVPENSRIDLILAAVKNASDMEREYTFRVLVRDRDQVLLDLSDSVRVKNVEKQ